ncbi:MAG: response regulator transcription factor [Acutalibacteraceae bacterium]|nr:response regulator transcription factor [Acutalibacteraceae bacterium]
MIYLLEDDESIRKFVTYALKQSGIEAAGFSLPSEFYSAMEKKLPDLVLLDIMLPEEDGLTVLKKLRLNPVTKNLPIIMLTAKSSEYDKVLGLDSGADDYIAKPFGTMELISRIKALLRRTSAVSDEYRFENLYINPQKHIVLVGSQPIELTFKEFEILLLMMKNQGTVFSRNTLLEQVWGYNYDGESRTVDVHIKTLRTKLGTAGELVKTVRGLGYKIG